MASAMVRLRSEPNVTVSDSPSDRAFESSFEGGETQSMQAMQSIPTIMESNSNRFIIENF